MFIRNSDTVRMKGDSFTKEGEITPGKKTGIPEIVVASQISEERDSGIAETLPAGNLHLHALVDDSYGVRRYGAE
jgi:hypothetical protein